MQPSTTTFIALFLRKLLSQRSVLPLMFIVVSLNRSPVNQVEGYAFAISKKAAYVSKLSWNPVLMIVSSFSKLSLVLHLDRKPAWVFGKYS